MAELQDFGSLRGVVMDKDFDAPLAGVQIQIVETGQTAFTTDQGNFVIDQVPPGRYTVIITKEGYVRQVKSDVLIAVGQLTNLEVSMSSEFTELDELVVQDILQFDPGSEAALLKLRFDSPALMDSISADLMSRAGASDAASALRLVSGTSVEGGKYAVVRGLPDRYVSSQMNGVRLPSADEETRAVQLDQFPAAVIESIQVSKTFTPDQQGDASGGAVNVILKTIPDAISLKVKLQTEFNSQVEGANNFINFHRGSRVPQEEGQNWDGQVGVSEEDPPGAYKWAFEGGGSYQLSDKVKIGGFGSVFYERDVSFYDNGIDDAYWVFAAGQPLTPEAIQADGVTKTQLFDITRGTLYEQFGQLATLGIEIEDHSLGFTYLHTEDSDQTATLAIDTRGKEYFFPGFDPYVPTQQGNLVADYPYIRSEALVRTERETQLQQLTGKHKLPTGEMNLDLFNFLEPELDWSHAKSSSDLNEPDKRLFGGYWQGGHFDSANEFAPAHWFPFKPAENITIGNLQRIFKEINEDSNQYAINLKFPFAQWSGDKGYWKFGIFHDNVKRNFNQDTFSNFNDPNINGIDGDFSQPWSAVFPNELHPITGNEAVKIDVDYQGNQKISARYAMLDLPLNSYFNLIGGARAETTKIDVVNFPEEFALFFPPSASGGTFLADNPRAADVNLAERKILPSIGFLFHPLEQIRFRAAYSETLARPTFKELTPVVQQEFLGGPIFIGNPDLVLSEIQNNDLRLDFIPYEDGLFSISYFYKRLRDPIETTQRFVGFTYDTARNFPKGTLKGWEFEARQNLGHFWELLNGFSVGANATFLNAKVKLPDDLVQEFIETQTPETERDMTNAPEHLYNLFLTYDCEGTGSQISLFYSVQGDTLVAGAAKATERFVPSIYAKEYGTLNLSFTQKIGPYLKLTLQGKNLTNPNIEEVYRSTFIEGDVTRSNYTKGIDYTIGLSAEIRF